MGDATSSKTTLSAPLRRGRFFCAPTLAIATLGGVAATLAAVAARQWWLLELATHFTPYTAGVLLLLVVCWGAWRRWYWMGICLVCFTWQAWQLAPLYRSDPAFVAAANIDAPPLRVMSQNVLSHNQNYAAVLELVAQENPDVLVLIETNQEWLQAMAPLEATYPHQLHAPSRGNFGISLYSLVPLELAEVLFLGKAKLPSLTAKIETNQGPLRLLATHTLPPMGKTNAALRNDQLVEIAKWVAQNDLPTLVVGDLNITPWSPMFHDLLEVGRLRNTQRGYGVNPTWYAHGLVGIPIDHALVTSGIGIVDRRVGPDVGSDHRGLVVDLMVKPPIQQDDGDGAW